MRLKVNGISVRVVDRIEIEITVPEDGDTLLNGMSVIIKGGPLTIESGDSEKHAALYICKEKIDYNGAICFFVDRPPIEFIGNSTPEFVGGTSPYSKEVIDETVRLIEEKNSESGKDPLL